MKNGNKTLIIASVAFMTIGVASIIPFAKMQLIPEVSNKKIVQAYNYHPANILDNVFEKDGYTILPFIFTNADQTVSKTTIISEFNKRGLTVTTSLNSTVGTGTQIKVKENSKTYTVLAYGDIDGDGAIDVFDAQKIIKHFVNGEKDELEGVYKMAANVDNEEDEVDVFDAQRIVKFFIGTTTKLVTNEPTSIKEADKTAPVITLNGAEKVEIYMGSTYTEQGAKAVDNYDGDISYKIKTSGTINTSKLGTYTITYTVSDSNGNTSKKIRTIVVVDALESITIKTNPTKLNYNYSETTLDLTGAVLQLNMKTGNNKTINITSDMISAYDLSTAGTKIITVNYQGKTTSFEVKVLNQITGLDIDKSKKSGIQELKGGYQAISQEEFVLGAIKQTEVEGSSILKAEQLKAEVNENDITSANLTISFEEQADGSILIKGKAQKPGNYTITPYIEYGETKIKADTTKLNVKKSDVIKNITISAINEGEVKYNKAEPVIKTLTVVNIHDEEIDVSNSQVVFNEISTGITITKLDSDKIAIPESDTNTEVKYLEFATTLKTEQEVTAKVKVLNKGELNQGIEQTITFKIGNESILSNIQIDESILNTYLSVPSDKDNVKADNGNIYTILPITFLNQDNEKMNVEANKIVINPKEQENGKLSISLPEAKVLITIGDDTIVRTEKNTMSVKYYDENGNIAEGETQVSKIGFSILLNSAEKTVDLASLNGKSIVMQSGSNQSTLSVKINFKELKNLTVNTTSSTLNKDGEGNYTTKLNEQFTLGSIEIGKDEQPITPNMLETDIIGDKEGITISYDQKEDGTILLKGILTKQGIYQVTPKVGNVKSKINLLVKGVEMPNISSIDISNTNVQIGEYTTTSVTAKSDINSTDEPIKAGDITFSNNDILNIELLNSNGEPIDSLTQKEEIVKELRLSVKDGITTEQELPITITLFTGKENEYSTIKTFSIYAPIPKSVKIANEIKLYNTASESNTVEYNGLVYTLLPVELFADAAQTKSIVTQRSLFTENSGASTGKVLIQQEKVDVDISGIGIIPKTVLNIAYFREKQAITNGQCTHIGIAMTKSTTDQAYNKEDLNGKKVTLSCGTFSTEINISYINN